MHDDIQGALDAAVARWRAFDARPRDTADKAWVADYLALMYAIDQGHRRVYIGFVERGDAARMKEFGPCILEADRSHQRKLQALVDESGWPTLSEYGADTCEHAWMIALHADSDVHVQRWAQALMAPLAEQGEVDPVHFAALDDRIALSEGRPQRWGMFYNLVDGEEVLCPTEDPEGLAARRAELGLGDTRFRRG
ncbi:MAG: hypothetical protein QF464_16075 [Myxococcota bacterium]|nr:hypothetical protein [Myxococcota bacterium]